MGEADRDPIRRYGATTSRTGDRTSDQHDAYSVAAWPSRTDRDGSRAAFLKPDVTPPERAVAQFEGWIWGA
jgi:hypothetical protein